MPIGLLAAMGALSWPPCTRASAFTHRCLSRRHAVRQEAAVEVAQGV